LGLESGAILRVGDVLLVVEPGHTLDDRSVPQVAQGAVPGDATLVRALRAQLARAAPDRSPVLIIGDTGTGKEQLAREVHRLSGRAGPFLAINCATFSEQIIESQLFGHVKGAFTGAATDHPGLFRAAEGGTLFLDEIGEMPKELQAKLLRAIQEREVLAVGATRPHAVDVRVVAATHRHLAARARAGEFRQDLYARLALWELKVPSLDERKGDLLLWIERLYQDWLKERNLPTREALSFDADAAQALLLSPWPENLRTVGRLVHDLASRRIVGRPVERRDLPAWLLDGPR
jgi:transcriptional regulator with PAS, ATPase and Fis domain